VTSAEVLRIIRAALARAASSGGTAITIADLDRYLVQLEAGTQKAGEIDLEKIRLASQEQLESFRDTLRSGSVALNSGILVNGGAAVALLAFIGHLVTGGASSTVSAFAGALIAYVVGVAAAAVGTGVRYVTQANYYSGKKIAGHVANYTAIFLGAASYGAFIIGGALCYRVFRGM
jgi:hypothetical protein